MLKYNLDLDGRSEWLTTTPGQTAASMPFYITEMGKFYCGPGFFTERSHKESYLFFYTFAGRALLEAGGASLELSPYTAVILDCRAPQRYRTVGERWHHYWVHLDGQGVATYCGLINTPGPCPVAVPDSAGFPEAMERLLESMDKTDVLSLSECCLGLHSLLSVMLKSRTERETGRSSSRATDILAAAAYIREHCREQVSVDGLVKRFNLSKYYFIRLFRQYMGTTPYDYLLHCRINLAKTLLTTTGMSVEQVAAYVGFSDPGNFINHFKRLTGSKPTTFRGESLYFGPGGDQSR